MVEGRVVARGGHARHDRFAIAEALGGGPLPPTVGLCPACGALHRDLLSIQTVLRHAWVPRRPRDLRLTTADVARLRPVLWLRLLLLLGSSRDTTTRPLAVALTSLGIAGFALANVSLATIGTSGAAAASAPPESATSVAGSQHGQPAIDQRLPRWRHARWRHAARSRDRPLGRLAGRRRRRDRASAHRCPCAGDAMIRNRARYEAV
jgi:hypothetical protein